MNFDTYAEKGKLILKELALELGMPEDTARAGRIFRAVLHTLRSLLPLEENLQLTAQLLMALKGVYLDGWKYTARPKRIKQLADLSNEVFETEEITVKANLQGVQRHHLNQE